MLSAALFPSLGGGGGREKAFFYKRKKVSPARQERAMKEGLPSPHLPPFHSQLWAPFCSCFAGGIDILRMRRRRGGGGGAVEKMEEEGMRRKKRGKRGK